MRQDMQGEYRGDPSTGLVVFSIVAECHTSFLLKEQDRSIPEVRESQDRLPEAEGQVLIEHSASTQSSKFHFLEELGKGLEGWMG